MLDLSEKLKSLGVRVGVKAPLDVPRPVTAPLAKSVPAHHQSISRVVPGRLLATAAGEAFVVGKDFPTGEPYGHGVLALTELAPALIHWSKEPGLADCPLTGLAFLDTETTGLAGGSGTYAFLIGAGRFTDSGFQFAQFFMRDPGEETAQLLALRDFLQPCRAIVTFNGKSFDAPLLQSRYITNRLPSPLSGLMHLDLLHLSRRLWSHRLESCALSSLERHILDVRRSEDDVPGFLIPQLYFDYLRSGNAEPLQGVFYHNELDVLSMAVLLQHQSQLLTAAGNGTITDGGDLIAIAKLFEDLDDLPTARAFYIRSFDFDLAETALREGQERLSFIYKRAQNYDEALRLWQQAANRHEIYAFVELAKYYEHQTKEIAPALQWTKAALQMVCRPSAPLQLRLHWLADLKHRAERLQRKLQSPGTAS